MRIQVNEQKESPTSAKEIALRCNDCQKLCVVVFPYKPSPQQRIEMIRKVLDDHRPVCSARNPSDEKKVYEIWYPRRGW